MENATLNQMAAYLVQRHIKVPRDWLVAMREWVLENEPEFCNNMKEAAYLHVLATNLNELECACLPPVTADVVMQTLRGKFFLQVNSVMDISQSAYRQLKKLDNAQDSDSEVTAFPDYTFTREDENSSRTLSLELTDGVQVVSGMEWKHIPFLSVALKPGSKILVYGEVECRRGILLLCPENTKYLGGEVDELIEVNSQYNLLKREVEKCKARGGSGDNRRGRLSPKLLDNLEQNVNENRLPYVYPSSRPSVPTNRRANRSASRRPYSFGTRRATASPIRRPRGSATGRARGSTSRRSRGTTSRRPRAFTSRRPRAPMSRGENIPRNYIPNVSRNPPPTVMQNAAASACSLPFGSDKDEEQFFDDYLKYCSDY